MPARSAIVTGASRGIGRAIAEALGADGYALTLTARKPDGLAATAEAFVAQGWEVQHLAADVGDEAAIAAVVAMHRERHGRLDVLVNNAGVGFGATAGAHATKFVDLQLAVNLRSIILFYREALDLLRLAGAAHRRAQVVNLASIAGESPAPWLSVYGATKAGVIAYTQAMNKELNGEGIRSVALCPGWVDTDMTEFIKDSVAPEEMIRSADIVAAVRFVLSLSPTAVVPEIVFQRPAAPFSGSAAHRGSLA